MITIKNSAEVKKILREARKAKRMPRRVLAEKLDYTQQAIVYWETGKTMPPLDTIIKWGQIVGVELKIHLTK